MPLWRCFSFKVLNSLGYLAPEMRNLMTDLTYVDGIEIRWDFHIKTRQPWSPPQHGHAWHLSLAHAARGKVLQGSCSRGPAFDMGNRFSWMFGFSSCWIGWRLNVKDPEVPAKRSMMWKLRKENEHLLSTPLEMRASSKRTVAMLLAH